MHISESSLSFLARFAKSPDGREITEAILKPMLAEVEGKLRTATGEEVYRQQGRAQQLDELLKVIAEASQKLNRAQHRMNLETHATGWER